VAHIEDEVAYLFQAQVFAKGEAYVDAPFHTNCFFAPFVLDYEGRRFGKYPPGWPALLSVGIRMGQAWFINASLVALTIALVFRLGRETHDARVGVLAAGLGSVSPFVLLMSASLMSHPACLLFVTIYLWCFWRAHVNSACDSTRADSGDLWSLAAGVALGAAFVIRPFSAAAIALPGIVWAVWRLVRCWHEGWPRREQEWRRLWMMGIGFAPLALLVPAFNAIWTGDPLLSPYVIFWPYDRLGFGPGHGPEPQGNTIWLGLSSALASLGHLANYLHGWPLLSMTLVVLLFLFKPRRPADLFMGATVVSLIFAYVLYWTSGDVFGPRYAYEATSALLVLSAAGIVRVWKHLAARDATERWRFPFRRASLFVGVLVALMLVSLGAYLPWQFRRYRGLYGVTGRPREVLQGVELRNALVIVRDERGWKDYAVAFSMNDPTLDGEVVYANDCGPRLDQLLAHYPGRDVYWFDGEVLTPYDGGAGG
jgi:4-amino-4-deoxy-L-arabinose transferase-like glycosyltransferase